MNREYASVPMVPTPPEESAPVADDERAVREPEDEVPAGQLQGLTPDRQLLLRRLLEKRAKEKRDAERIRPRGSDGPVPLSFEQQRLWFIQQMDPSSAAYNMPFPLRLLGALDARAVRRALTELVRRHESLRTVFSRAGEEPVQVVRPPAPFPLAVADLGGLAPEDREREAQRLVEDDSVRPFDLARGPLVRAFVARLSDGEWGLVLNLHHIVSDGWSTGVLVREVSALYAAYARGEESPLPPLPVQYPDFALWQRTRLSGAALEEQVGWWRRTLAGAPPVLDLPTDRPRPPVPGSAQETRGFALHPQIAAELRELARSEGVTAFVLFLGAFQALLARWSGQEDVSVGTPVAGRNRLETEGLIGFFVNTLVLRAELAGDPTLRAVVHRARDAALGAFGHQDVPFEKLVEELQPERSLRHTPFFQVMFSLQAKDEDREVRLGTLAVEPLARGRQVAKFDLTLSMVDEPERITAAISYRTELFDESTVQRMATHFRNLLAALATAPDRPLWEVDLMGPEERGRVLAEWSEGAPAPAALPVHRAFAEQAARTPGAVAVVAGGERTTYAELDARAARLARLLAARGVRPGSVVGVALERSADLVVALLAVLRAGAAYLPLDPDHPAERLAHVLEDAGVRVLLARGGAPEGFGGDVVRPDDAPDEPAAAGAEDPRVPVWAESLAYVIYTSGSTGRPKGVAMTHGALANHMAWMQRAYPLASGDRVLQKTAVGFDASVWEFWAPLTTGAALVMAPPGAHRDPAALVRAVAEEAVTVLQLVPSMLPPVLDAGLGRRARLRRLFCGGEALPAAPAARARAELGAEVVNLYGPTEVCIDATWHPVADEAGPTVPIGRPLDGVRAYVLDRGLRPAPAGVAGELFLGGVQLARGYLGRPDLTAERFVPDGVSGEAGARLYRTGDRVRWLAGGELEYLGRLDEQVKVRGFRIEPGEVEGALREHPAVRQAVVVAREAAPGDLRLVAYVVPAGGEAPPAAELRAWARRRLPDHMVPGAFVPLDTLPLTASGKLDRRALPAPGAAEAGEAYVAPRTPTEEILAGIWADVLRRERVGAADDFFALGGHSLLATQVTSRAQAALGVEVPLRALFEAPTVAGLAERVDEWLRAGAGVRVPPLVPVPRDGPLPLSFAQQRLWFIDQLEPGSAAYNMPFPLRLRGVLDARALERSLTELVRRHESLRTVLARVDGEPVQVIRPPAPRVLPTVDLAALPAETREREARRLAVEDARRPFDLSRGPLLRASLARLAGDDSLLLFNLHHVVGDGWSMGVLVREVSVLYGAFARGEPSPLPELPVQYADYAAWQRAWLQGETLERQIGYWKERLGGAPPLLELPTDHPRPPVAGLHGGARGFVLPEEASRALRSLARAEGATLFAVLLAGFQAFLARWSGQDDVVVGTPIAGRARLETEGLIGFFVNTLVLRADLAGEPSFRALVGQARERVLEAHAHQDLPFERLVDELRTERSLAHAPLFQVMFTLESAGTGEGALELGAVRVEPVAAGSAAAKFDLTVGMRDHGERLAGGVTYRTDLWEGGTVERMLAGFASLLEGMAADPDRPFTELPLLDADERRRVLEEWNATERPYPAGLRVHDLFAAQAARTPDAAAVVHRGETLTYAELDRRSARLASALRRRGAGPETRVGVCMSRTPDLPVALLAVLRAGGAYVPLDPAYPRERLGYMLEDARVALVLTEPGLAGRLPESGAGLVFADAASGEPDVVPESGVLPENLSHVIFTSGSTGRPKGVMIRHSSTVVLLHWLRESVSDEERASTLFSTSINFDVSVAEVFGTLCWGGKLVLVENALELASVEEPVVYASMVPSAAAELLRTGGIPASVRTLNLGGEALPNPLAQGLYALSTVEKVGNLYGPTEDTTYSTYSVVERGGERVHVGRPVANTRAYVLDRHLRPVPVGVVGELYLAGDGLARGYASRPDLTAERFLPSPFDAPGSRMYRVMDRVRWRADGVLEYFGRTDFQVKVRGFRIELGEVEAVLGRHPSVRDVVAVVREDRPGDRRIVAYVTGAEPSPPELRAHAAAHLPEYMVPSAVVVLDALPLSPAGKTDRAALPAPEASSAGVYLAPRDALERALAEVWEEVLGVERVGVRDGFFELGGHSLLAVRLMAQVEKATGARLPLATLFTASTVEALAAVLRRGDVAPDASPLVPIRPGGSRAPLFLVHAVGGDVLSYAALAGRLDPEQPVYGLRSRALSEEGAGDATVEEMAAGYLRALRRVRPEGPYRLGGWSMGGVVAFEMARQLEAAGERVELLALIDAHAPALQGRALPDDERVLVRTFAADLGLAELPPAEGAAPGGYLRRVLESARAAGVVPADVEPEAVERLYRVFRANLAALHAYVPGRYGGAVTLLRAAEHDRSETETAGWERVAAGGVAVRSVPGSHFALVREPYVAVLARELAEALGGD